MHINLLPASFQLKLLVRASLRRWSLIWGTAVGCALAYCSLQSRELFEITRRVAILEAECLPLRELEQDIVSQQERLTRLNAEGQILEQLQPEEHTLPLLGVLSQSARRTGGKVQFQRFNYVAATKAMVAVSNKTQGPTTPTITPTTDVGLATLSLHGVAEDDDALAAFVAALRELQVFHRVELKSSSQLRTQTGSHRQYQLECRF